MKKVTYRGEVMVYTPYSGIRIPEDAHLFEGHTWGHTSYSWNREINAGRIRASDYERRKTWI